MSIDKIVIKGAREHNLKNVDLTIPRDKLVVLTGLSGSGKSSLAFDTLYAEGQRRYIETFSAYARNFLENLERPDVDKITGLSPVISIEQKTTNKNPRSTVGTVTEIYDFLRLLYARAGEAYSYVTGEKMVKYTEEKIIELEKIAHEDGLEMNYQNIQLTSSRKAHRLVKYIQNKQPELSMEVILRIYHANFVENKSFLRGCDMLRYCICFLEIVLLIFCQVLRLGCDIEGGRRFGVSEIEPLHRICYFRQC